MRAISILLAGGGRAIYVQCVYGRFRRSKATGKPVGSYIEMRRIKPLMIIFLCILLADIPTANADDGNSRDAGLWVFAGVSPKPFGGKWQMLCGLEYRSKRYLRETSLWCVSMNVNYIFNSFIQTGAGYEFFLNREADGSFSPEYRYYPEAILSCGSGAFSASLRSRIMNTFTRICNPQWEGRNRLKTGYAIPGTCLKPFVAVEPYLEIYPVKHRFKKIRYFAGCSITLDRRRKFDVYYLREDYLHDPFLRNVIQIEYNFCF
ncbi:MAG: DUF2490 domain-containing protein [Tannerella sp.]|jgi:hypothetical protein|nr:DUF2490 domain-containing protein [Tannerella sp.]